MKIQRTGLTEGSLIFNEWLKTKGLFRKDTEGEFINWLYSTSGFYDKDIKGSNFDIDIEAAVKSVNYQRFLSEFSDSLLGSDMIHLMIHGKYHLNGQDKQAEFAARFAPENYCFWKDVPFMSNKIGNKRLLVVSSIAQVIWAERVKTWPMLPYNTPTTHLNSGPDKNYFETLDRVTEEILKQKDYFDMAVISFGAYGCLLADRLNKAGKDVMTVGSGIYDLFPVKDIPAKFRPKDWEKIEGGRYWLTNNI